MNTIDVKTLTEYEVSKHFENFEQKNFKRYLKYDISKR